jgi:hypothetical protein
MTTSAVNLLVFINPCKTPTKRGTRRQMHIETRMGQADAIEKRLGGKSNSGWNGGDADFVIA